MRVLCETLGAVKRLQRYDPKRMNVISINRYNAFDIASIHGYISKQLIIATAGDGCCKQAWPKNG